MKTTPKKRSLIFWFATTFLVVGTAIGLWSHFHRGHTAGHDHDEHGETALSLNDGKRWEADLPLRTGMQRIRDAVEPVVLAQTKGRVAAPDTERLAAAIQENVSYLFANCKLPPKADATLHVLITDLLSGSAMLKEDPNSRAGSALLVEALRKYPTYFDHPAWKPLDVPPSS